MQPLPRIINIFYLRNPTADRPIHRRATSAIDRLITLHFPSSNMQLATVASLKPSPRIMSREPPRPRANPLSLRGRGGGAPTPTRSTTTTTTTRAAAADASSPTPNKDVQGEMLPAGITPNNPIVRLATLAITTATAAYSSSFLPSTALAFFHLLVFGTWFGTLAYTSFIIGVVAFRTLPRQTFGLLQSKLFPIYFMISSIAPAVLLASLHIATGGVIPARQVQLLGASVVASAANLFFTEPTATHLMFERYALENAKVRDEGKITALRKQFGKWHGISSLLNLVVLVCAVGHAYFLGGRLLLA